MKKDKKKKDDFEDDGRVIANMNVEGMPWYVPKKAENAPVQEKLQLSKEGKMAAFKGVLLATLLVGGVFALAFTAFILICVFIWL